MKILLKLHYNFIISNVVQCTLEPAVEAGNIQFLQVLKEKGGIVEDSYYKTALNNYFKKCSNPEHIQLDQGIVKWVANYLKDNSRDEGLKNSFAKILPKLKLYNLEEGTNRRLDQIKNLLSKNNDKELLKSIEKVTRQVQLKMGTPSSFGDIEIFIMEDDLVKTTGENIEEFSE